MNLEFRSDKNVIYLHKIQIVHRITWKTFQYSYPQYNKALGWDKECKGGC